MNEESTPVALLRSQRPRNPRVPVEFALEVRGTDTSGKTFQLSAQAIKISRGGATIIIDADVKPGSIVRLTPPFGHELDAEVNGAWTDEIDGRRRIGVKLLDTDGWFAE
ncbi:MAG TPA: PilZ domain-containing protein [Pyrinomonadaceae bacterium]|nr:PilZ domain-containing protein [Pyrinomonadaceae bacterium]